MAAAVAVVGAAVSSRSASVSCATVALSPCCSAQRTPSLPATTSATRRASGRCCGSSSRQPLLGHAAGLPCAWRSSSRSTRCRSHSRSRQATVMMAEGAPSDQSEQKPEKRPPFGTTRADVLIIGVGVTVAGFALKAALQVAGVDQFVAGNIVMITLVFGGGILWASGYVNRVANKDMTYVKQLEAYEEAVIQKRLEEIPDAELQRIMDEIEQEKKAKQAKRSNPPQQNQ
eukprot:jgi/Chlat1/5331/Chrsp35S05200